ncbi:uncharacterized protein FIBRA_01499 [Fibroporia radiculosa]|uniref:Tryptophan synthase beta chain-like PALP domain-containing protein n=1 Tax=Fibroporia radiculosa TaxID=599839 RepID=J4I8I7_9APHY|nr:uncharacterized protein FIBRA_01499 [Fibroporia radiculosa]CCL99481.1 predicted protein [Fibroporia radiculosa]
MNAGSNFHAEMASLPQTPLPLVRPSVLSAHEVIKPHIHHTPVFTSSSLSATLPEQNVLYFKAENMQKGGAFKYRGASYSLSCLTEQELANGETTPGRSRSPPSSAAQSATS